MTEGIRWYREWDLVLIGCGKAKQPETSPAIDLYTGPVFGAHLAIAEHLDAFPMVLSAKHGIVERNVEIEPYELAVGDLRGADLERWNEAVFRYVHGVLSQAADPRRISVPRDPAYDRPIKERCRYFTPEMWAFGPPLQPRVLVLAGAPYIDGWAPRIRALGYQVDDPLRGFTLGQRRAFARHFVTSTPAWKPGDRPLDLAEDAWLWPDVPWQPASRREQLLGEARDFLDDPLDHLLDHLRAASRPDQPHGQLGLNFGGQS